MADGQGPVLAPSVSLLHKGVNRFGFALFDTARKQITGAEVALYTAAPTAPASAGPYVARSESLEVKPQFQSADGGQDPNAAKCVYVADVPFKRNGKQAVVAIAQARRAPAGDQRLRRQRQRRRQDERRRPAVGDKAISDPHARR